ncbi:mitochondrial carrier [Nadsonia fulvescens var. elongata DSM 6958]|uniref:Mitochondrial carrier n=1 Tax=Nadsonia fulvescens var. elongata DSM 6958 TaxID=857566 RepID=A0A1E3PH11_9ASCO|nr:mitochondrial carrier [Nadsonia fulvescens var. elongata DSM 6958]
MSSPVTSPVKFGAGTQTALGVTTDKPSPSVVTTPVAKGVHYPFYFGGAASMVAACCTHPLDLAKVRLQTAAIGSTEAKAGFVKTLYRVARTEGFFKIYDGLSASLLRQATYSTARLGVYEALKQLYIDLYPAEVQANHGVPPMHILLPISTTAGFIGGIIGNPSDIINIRMQNDKSLPLNQRRNYRNAFDGLRRLCVEEGPRTLFKGVMPNCSRGVLMTASQMVSYDEFKNLLVYKFHMDKDKKTTHFSASLLAGLVATTICSPVDVIKTRIMNDKKAHAGSSSSFSVVSHAIKNEGFGFAFKGWIPSFVRLGPHTIITFVVLEQLKHFYNKLE